MPHEIPGSPERRFTVMNTSLAPTLLARSLPRVDRRLRDLALILGSSLFVALMAQVRIPLPFTPVPLTGQTFAVLLVGAALGPRKGAAALLLYLFQGLIGLPVFAGGTSGLTVLLGPTGGYLVGFVVAAYLIGALAVRGLDRRIPSALLIFLLGEVVIYLFGVAWLSAFIGFPRSIIAGLVPFLIGDALKLIAAALVLPAAWKITR
jgi:biotin transport system substrate-specific component